MYEALILNIFVKSFLFSYWDGYIQRLYFNFVYISKFIQAPSDARMFIIFPSWITHIIQPQAYFSLSLAHEITNSVGYNTRSI